MKTKLGHDYDFYFFVRRKFYATWKAISEQTDDRRS